MLHSARGEDNMAEMKTVPAVGVRRRGERSPGADGRSTIRDVALKAGVSLATASRALSGHGMVRPATRAKVEKAASELSYSRMVAAAVLSSRAHRHPETVDGIPVAYLYSKVTAQGGNRYFEFGLNAAKRRIQDLGYAFLSYNLAEVADHRALSRQLYARGVAGIVLGQVFTPILDAGFQWDRFPVVACESFGEPWPGHMVRIWQLDLSRRLVRACVARGYRRIAFCPGTHSPPRDDDFDAVGGAMSEQFIRGGCEFGIFPGTIKEFDAKRAWVREFKPDAVIGFSGLDYEIVRKVRVAGRVPGFCALKLNPAEVAHGVLTGFSEPYELLARHAVDLLDQEIRYRRPPVPADPVHVVVIPPFIEGRTLGTRLTG